MKVWKALPFLGLGIILLMVGAGCSSSSKPVPTQLKMMMSSLPAGTVSTAYSTPLSASGGTAPYTWSITSGSLPSGLSLSGTGTISGMPTAAGSSTFTLQVTDSASAPASATASLTITIAGVQALTITSTSLPAGTVGVGYSASLAATGGLTPYTWTVLSGNLPQGLSLSAAGAISGTPTTTGTSTFTVQVSDSESTPAIATAQLSITVNTVTIAGQSLPAGTINVAYSTTLEAVGGVTPYSWTLMSGTLPTGLTLSAGGVIAGTATATGTSTFTVQVADAEVTPATATAQLSIAINSAGDSGLLKGNYAFLLNGFNSTGAWTLAGSFVSDGQGNITSGVVDSNSVAGPPVYTTITGTYSIASSGLNTLTIQGQSYGPVTFAFVLSSSGNGRIIEYDDTTGSGSRGSGVLRKQDPSAFSLGNLNGGYVFGMTGVGQSGEREVNVGEFTLAAGNMTNGSCDVNAGGKFETCTFTGTVSAVDAQTGRATVTVQSNNGASHEAGYVVSASELLMEQIDSVPQTGNSLVAGSVLQQTGTFNNSSLNGLAVVYYQDVNTGGGADESGASILSLDGNGNSNILASDDDLAGTITQKSPSQGTYTVVANGAVTFTGGKNPPAGFLISQNKAFMVSTGSNPDFDWMEPQTGGPFSNASFQGTYAGGSLPPLDYANAGNEVDVGPADGSGTFTVGGDSSKSGGIDQSSGTIVSYSIAANGRGTAQSQGDKAPAVVYVISPTKSVVLITDTDARVLVFEH